MLGLQHIYENPYGIKHRRMERTGSIKRSNQL